MTEYRSVLERAGSNAPPPDLQLERILRRRDRKRRNQRIAAGVVGIAVFVAAVWIVTSGGVFDRSETSVVPGGDVTGPAETGPIETGPIETGPLEFGQGGRGSGGQGSPISLPVSVTDYLVDLETGARTPLPESIIGTEDVISDYAVSPDGSRLAYVRRDERNTAAIFVANLDGAGVEQVTSGDAGEPAWSPDGSRIAYVEHGNVFVLDLATSVSTQVTDEPDGGSAYAPTFTPDGESIVYGRWLAADPRGNDVRIVPVTGGESVRLVGGHGTGASSAALSPDGSLLSYACGDHYGSDLCLANADGTDARVLVAGDFPGNTYSMPSWSPDGTWIAYYWWQSGVYVVEVATGEETLVAQGAYPTWRDGHTLIVEADDCSLPPHKRCPF